MSSGEPPDYPAAAIRLRHSGLRAWRHGSIDLTLGKRKSAERLHRLALTDLVHAFLHDRERNADLFVLAHRVGVVVEREFGCPYRYEPKSDGYYHDCPIGKLHSRLGMSWGGVAKGRCSICDAEDLQCDHVPGRVYDGKPCVRVIYEVVRLEEISVTPNPRFVETFGVQVQLPRSAVRARLGRDARPGERLMSNHCQDCYGKLHATPEDLDPELWELPPSLRGSPDQRPVQTSTASAPHDGRRGGSISSASSTSKGAVGS